MTSRRAHLASSAVIVLIGASAVASVAVQELPRDARDLRQIAGAFPQTEPGPLERRAKPITPENPIPRRTHLVRPPYPPEAAAVNARAAVTLRVTLNELGRVGEVRTMGIPLLGSVTHGSPTEDRAHEAALLALARSAKDAVAQWLYEPPADGPIAFDVIIGFSANGEGEVLVHGTPGRGGQPLNPAVMPPPPQLAGLTPAPWAEGTVRVGGNIRQPTKVKHVAPVYPLEAKEARVTGVVILEARIEADGRVVNARVLRSIPELDQAAIDAVKQWEFTPTLLNGVPTPVLMTVTIQFSLN
jgi:TonB family protein